MKRFGSIFPFLEQGAHHPHLGRLVANAGFVEALIRHGTFDEYVFGSPSRSNLAAFREVSDAWQPSARPARVRYVDYAEWPAVLRREDFHVMHLGGWGYFMPGLHYLRTQLVPRPWPMTGVIHSLHGRDTINHAVRLVSAELLPCDAVFCTSRDGETALRRLLDSAAAIVGRSFRGQLLQAPLGVPDDLLDQPGDRRRARQRLRIPDDAFVILALGRMSVAQKMDPGPLCRAFARGILPRIGPGAVLVFAGGATPAELDLLRDTIRRQAIEANVRLHANFAPDQKHDVLAMADVLVAPTDNVQETFGLSLLEAQAAAVPVVASRYDGYKDLVQDGIDGFLVDTWRAPADPFGDWFDVMDATVAQLLYAQGIVVDLDQLADRVVHLSRNAEERLRMGRAGRDKVDRQYRWSRVVARYEQLWADLARDAAGLKAPPPTPNGFSLAPSVVFRHYASHALHGQMRVMASVSHLDEMPYREAAGWLKQPLLEALLRAAVRPVTVAAIVAQADVAPEHAWFAVAWLLRYGFLRFAESATVQA